MKAPAVDAENKAAAVDTVCQTEHRMNLARALRDSRDTQSARREVLTLLEHTMERVANLNVPHNFKPGANVCVRCSSTNSIIRPITSYS